MQYKFIRWLMGVSGIILIVVAAVVVYNGDCLSGFFTAVSGILLILLGLGE